MNFMQNSITNVNAETGIRYTVFSLNNLNIDDEVHEWPNPSMEKAYGEYCSDRLHEILKHPDSFDYRELLDELNVTNAEDAREELAELSKGACVDMVDMLFPEQAMDFWDGADSLMGAQFDKDGLKAEIIELGGAYLLMVFESPFTSRFRLCSPCVPNACDGDNPDPENGELGYDVPAEWVRNEEEN